MHKSITTIFSSQSTKLERLVHDEEPNDNEVMVSFADLQFDPEEDNVPNNMLMSSKQCKILNNKHKSILQIQADTRGIKFVLGIEVEYMFKSQKNRLKTMMENIKQQHVERLKLHVSNFEYEISKLCDVAKVCNENFVERIKKVEESVNLKVAELKCEMTKEVEKTENNYSFLHGKV